MSEQEKEIMKTFETALPLMSQQERRDLLNFSAGMAFMAARRDGNSQQSDSAEGST